MLALLSPLGATHDEAYHARSIWCGQGERSPYCLERFINEDGERVARTNIEIQNCQVNSREPLLCPTDRTGQSVFRTNDGLYPGLFYFTLSWFVVPYVSVSTVLVRLASISIITAVFGVTMWLLPSRHRLVLLLVSLTAFTGTGFFLFSSINPSSWTSFGVGVGWLAIHAALIADRLPRKRRLALTGVGLLASVMAVGSRLDSIPFLTFTAYLIGLHFLWVRFPTRRARLLAVGAITPIIAILLLERFAPSQIVFDVQRMYTYAPGQPNNLTFFTDNLLQGVPNALLALGTVPTKSGVPVPGIAYLSALVLLSLFAFHSYNRASKLQLFGALSSALVISFTIAAQVALVDNRDTGGVEPRYVYPLLVFAIGWWYLQGPDDLHARMQHYLRPAVITTTLIFSLFTFAAAERFVDRTSSGLRLLPEGPDNWWWSWAPFGPNVPLLFAPLFLWLFFTALLRAMADSPSLKQVIRA